MVAEPL